MQKFELILKNEKQKFYNQISWIIIIIHILVFLYLVFFSNDKFISPGSIAILILLFCCFLLKYYLYRVKKKYQIGIDVFFFILMIGWICNHLYWLSIIPMVFYSLSGIALRKLVTIFTEYKIIYPSFPLKTIYWKELNNTILKDGILSIDFKNNKIIQQLIDESKTQVNEKEFNDFCREQLNK